MRGVLADALTGAPGAALAGIGRDFAETKQNPSFVAAPVAPLGWEFAGAELGLGVAGLVVGTLTRDETWYETTEGLLFAGTADMAANVTHFVRNRMNASAVKAKRTGAEAAPAAPAKLVARASAENLVQPLPQPNRPTTVYRYKRRAA